MVHCLVLLTDSHSTNCLIRKKQLIRWSEGSPLGTADELALGKLLDSEEPPTTAPADGSLRNRRSQSTFDYSTRRDGPVAASVVHIPIVTWRPVEKRKREVSWTPAGKNKAPSTNRSNPGVPPFVVVS